MSATKLNLIEGFYRDFKAASPEAKLQLCVNRVVQFHISRAHKELRRFRKNWERVEEQNRHLQEDQNIQG